MKRWTVFMLVLVLCFAAGCSLKEFGSNLVSGDDPGTEGVIQAVSTGADILGMFIPGVGGIVGFGLAALQTVRKWKQDKKVIAGYESVAEIIRKASAGGIKTGEDVKQIVAAVQSAYNLYPDIRKDLEALWKSGKGKAV